MQKLNWRLLLIHTPAMILISLGARQFSYLSDIELLQSFYTYGIDDFYNGIQNQKSTVGERLTYFSLFKNICLFLGFTISFFISSIISYRYKINWFNSVLSLLISTLVYQYVILNFLMFKSTLLFFDIFIKSDLQLAVITDGGLLTILGLLLFFSRWSITFILKKSL